MKKQKEELKEKKEKKKKWKKLNRVKLMAKTYGHKIIKMLFKLFFGGSY